MAAGATYEPIATTTLASAATDITFSSIAGTYTDLRIVLTAIADVAGWVVRTQFNSDTASNYSITYIQGNGTAASSARTTSQSQIIAAGAGLSTTLPSFITLDIFSYAGSTNKTCLITSSEDQNGSGQTRRTVGLWRSTAAITSVKLFPQSDKFAAGTTATLYGIKAA